MPLYTPDNGPVPVTTLPTTYVGPLVVLMPDKRTYVWSPEVATYVPFDLQVTGYGYLVRWIDYTGEEVYSRRVLPGTVITNNPAAPAHDGLTFDAWHAQAPGPINQDTEIHANYYATDGKAHLLVDASALAGLTPMVKVAKSDTSTLLIEWGDGTTSTSSASGNVTVVKPVAYVAGSYDIKLSISSGAGTFTGGHGTNGNPLIAGVAVTEMWMRSSSTTVTDYAFNGTAFRTMRCMTGLGGITSIGANAFLGCFALVSAIMPLVTSIGAYAFQACYALVSAIMPLVTSIGANALQACFALVSVIMPLVTSIGANAFQSCPALVSAIMPLVTSIGAYAFQACYALVSAIMPLVTSIGAYAFQACYALVSAIMPLATSIGASAFQACYALVSVVMPLVASIGASAFLGCFALVSAIMPLVTSIGAYAFQSCRRLRSVGIGPNCTLIDVLSFDGSRSLISLTVQATTPPTLASVATISDYDPRMLIYVPTGSVAAYRAATNWASFSSRIVGY